MFSKIIDGCIVVEVPFSNFDRTNADKFKKNLLNSYLSSTFSDMIIDMKKVSYIDAAGLEALLFAGSLVQEESGKLSLCSVSSYVRQILMQTRLYRFFDINRTVDESMEFIKDKELTGICNYQTLRNKLKTQIA